VPGSYVDVAVHNAATQVTIAGDAAGLDAASALCRQAGARRCVPLAVSAAFHSAAMRPAADGLAPFIDEAEMSDAAVPLVANVCADPITAAAAIRQELAEQVARPVLWGDSLQLMVDQGARLFIEFGAGQVLTNLVQRLDPTLGAVAAGDTASIASAVELAATTLAGGGA
jgi:[acyl-carrier-protein] S-malonyltransferase